ncbi:MAG: peptidoglycan-binding protein [Verrucomicrobiota bacterium]|nr:peptidoglycan-binding protein [Verrucomicrobiota bacterium]
MTKGIRWVCLLLFVSLSCALADDVVRQAQEELRRRNLYFGDIDGQMSPDLVSSLKRYQARKGFTASGRIDEITSTSLNIQSAEAAPPERSWPDLPVLKSDSARELDNAEQQRIAQQAEENLDVPTPSPIPPAEQPSAAQSVTPERITSFVEQYLRDGETNDIAAQTRYFSYPVDYFDHGFVNADFVRKDVTNYCKRWPERKYMLTEPVTFAAGSGDGETIVEFPIAFSVRNQRHSVAGRTKNTWHVRPEGDDLKIISIREQRLRN